MSDLRPGVDYYMEHGLFVLTEDYLRRRGSCCESGCRHCPYGFNERARAAGERRDDDGRSRRG